MSIDLDALKEEMFARYGTPRRLRELATGHEDIIAFGHDSEEAAEAFAAVDEEHYGHPAAVEYRDGAGWVCLLDLRPAIERAQREAAA